MFSFTDNWMQCCSLVPTSSFLTELFPGPSLSPEQLAPSLLFRWGWCFSHAILCPARFGNNDAKKCLPPALATGKQTHLVFSLFPHTFAHTLYHVQGTMCAQNAGWWHEISSVVHTPKILLNWTQSQDTYPEKGTNVQSHEDLGCRWEFSTTTLWIVCSVGLSCIL